MARQPKLNEKAKKKVVARKPASTRLQRAQDVVQPPSEEDQVDKEPTPTLPEENQVNPPRQTAILENYEVFRSELEKAKDINEVCSHLNVNMESLYDIARGRAFPLNPNEGTSNASTVPVTTLLEEKNTEETSNVSTVPVTTLLEEKNTEETSAQPNRSDIVQEQQEEKRMETGEVRTNDLKVFPLNPKEGTSNVSTAPVTTLLEEKHTEETSAQPNISDIVQERQELKWMETGEVRTNDLNMDKFSEQNLSQGDRPELEGILSRPELEGIFSRPELEGTLFRPELEGTLSNPGIEQAPTTSNSFLNETRTRSNLFLRQTSTVNNVPTTNGFSSEETRGLCTRPFLSDKVENLNSPIESNLGLMSLPSNLFGQLRNFLLMVWDILYDIYCFI
ncbi:hypothetical protein AVEN_178844-1 [Araneus ventricosus]|uniref:Uncharacterized protein n=1 Tax=Araneus ventricosus TaxID=182803 RepID=A0A4Y2BG95_ARAVE|nr:hypothetical protein AVEN_178844-1 [Araneus ventricosus]